MSQILTVVYYNGRKIDAEEGLSFEGEMMSMQLKRGMSLRSVKRKIKEKLKLGNHQVISRLTCRLLSGLVPRKYIPLHVADDDDVEFMINAFKHQTFMAVLELYADIDQVGSSSAPVSTYLTNTQTVSDVPELRMEQPGVGEEYDNAEYTVNLEDDHDVQNMNNVEPDAFYTEDENERVEGDIPDGDEADTDVDGDFDANLDTPAVASLILTPSPVNVYGEQHGT